MQVNVQHTNARPQTCLPFKMRVGMHNVHGGRNMKRITYLEAYMVVNIAENLFTTQDSIAKVIALQV